jgi:cytoskeletal protein CcmA (bactofilin family)
MTDVGVETMEAPAVNGDREIRSAELPITTVLAKEDSLSGRLQIRGNGSVMGTFSGRIDCDGELLIGPEAHVEADLKANKVTIAGFVKGNVIAMARLKIANTGRLEGDARVGALVVLEGGVHHGVIRVHPEGVPDGPDTSIVESPRSAAHGSVVASVPNSLGKVRKFWGEFF